MGIYVLIMHLMVRKMKKIHILGSSFLLMALASTAGAKDSGFYVGLGAGMGVTDMHRTLEWEYPDFDKDVFASDVFASAPGESVDLLAGWRTRAECSMLGSYVWGFEGSIGYAFQETSFWADSGLNPNGPDIFDSRVKRKFNITFMGVLGREWGLWTAALKFGMMGSEFTHTYQEVTNTVLQKKTVSTFAPGIAGGAFIEHPLGPMHIRLDYVCALHNTVNEQFYGLGAYGRVVQEARSPVVHRSLVALLWRM